MSTVVNAKIVYDESMSEPDMGDAKYAIIIDHQQKSILVQKYFRMYSLINKLLRANMRFTIHRVLTKSPTPEQLTHIFHEIF